VVTLEEHSEIGGLGSLVAECLFHMGWTGRFLKVALPDQFCNHIGHAEYLRDKSGISSARVLERILALME
jgi:transketolase